MSRLALVFLLAGCHHDFGLFGGSDGARQAGDTDDRTFDWEPPADTGDTGGDAPGDGDGPGGDDPGDPGDGWTPDTGWDPGDDEDLCRTRGFWLNHPDDWPVGSVTLGNETVSIADGIALFELSTEGDASLTLAVQLLATKLNLELGADPGGILPVVADADAWLAAHDDGDGLPYDVDTSSVAGAEAIALSEALDDFNNETCW